MKSSHSCNLGKAVAFSLVELFVGISIIAVLAVLVVPVVGRIRDGAKQAECMNHLRVWGQAILRYAGDNEGRVQWNNWQSIGSSARYYDEYLADSQVLFYGKTRRPTEMFRKCPATRWNGQGNAPVDYAMIRPTPNQSSAGSYALTRASHPSGLLLMVDSEEMVINSQPAFQAAVEPLCVAPDRQRHGGSVNMLFGDAHVEKASWAQLDGGTSEGKAYVEDILKLQR